MGGRTRARGEKEPTGKTKSTILLYLANNGESTFTQIRIHLQEQCNIKSSKDVRLHLEDLASDDRFALIDKIPHGNGNANSYRIRDGFTGLKRLHNFLNRYGAVPALMKTRYFRDYTTSRDFIVKARANISRNTTLALYDSIMDDKKYEKLKSLLRDISEDDRAMLIAWMDRIRCHDRDDMDSGGFLLVLDSIKSGDIDRLGDIMNDFVQLSGVMDTGAARDKFSRLMFELAIPESQREKFSAILRLSPGAFDYMLNSTSSNPLFPPNPFPAYVTSMIISRMFRGQKALFDESMGRWADYVSTIPKLSGEPPILLITRSLFVADMVRGDLAVKEVPDETLRLIFSDT
ncbi:hypothetical protein CUJ83_02785 [Methanocella sp. CWC-04]|uniref:Uncharacterized protein n=1 Tax=Methanooceanicella nereidis TaxID=2052831 RepID=A0AAP2W542_9EURY|nr:hypothetical protein [Methanocella sp. CWC-04]MCD1293923.1 hypothetical protein [Methanocella sp. CWC-04]